MRQREECETARVRTTWVAGPHISCRSHDSERKCGPADAPSGEMVDNFVYGMTIFVLVLVGIMASLITGVSVNEAHDISYLTTDTEVSPSDSGVLICDEVNDCYFLSWEDVPKDFRDYIEDTS